jgi:ATP/maltotriose-dependent transcriptional regulator MalT
LGQEGVRNLFEKASDWYENRGLYDEAVDAALTAGLFDRAMQSIEKFIEIHDITGFRTLNRWVGKVPAELVLTHPVVCFAFARSSCILPTASRLPP